MGLFCYTIVEKGWLLGVKKDQVTKRYLAVTLLNIIITLAEFIGGALSGSLALLSDAVHNLSDVGAIILSFVAHLISKRKRDQWKTFGYERVETLAAFTNGVILIIISIFLLFEAIQRFFDPQPVKGGLMLTVAVVGLVANAVSMLVIGMHAKNNLNIKATVLHMMSDALSSVVVVIGGLVIMVTKISWLDPLLTILVSIFVFIEAVKISIKAANVLMETNPDIDLEKIRTIVLAHPEVKHLHHVHIWRYSEDYIMLDAHLNVDYDLPAGKFEQLCQQISDQLATLGINHVNFQAECERGKNDEMIASFGHEE